ncbi:C40 family peptidase [Riemerella columbina]|uniref:C40 family peptidase n=1 Tax=Riemerella columbina TaxID=103810 RepID=UPI0003783E96|nr:C40 family peptidase [Riemerella columbina]
MKKFIGLFLIMMTLYSCGTSHSSTSRSRAKSSSYQPKTSKTLSSRAYNASLSRQVVRILKDAEKYIGTPYKYAGNTSSGFDCSGLVCKVFLENDKSLPRRSADQALEGVQVAVSQIRPGDLVFFATSGGSKVSHVGIVYDILPDGEITFIHASSSKGVMVSSLNQNYWNKAFLFARRVL